MGYYSIFKVQEILDSVEFTVEYNKDTEEYTCYSSVQPRLIFRGYDQQKVCRDCLHAAEDYIYTLADYHNGKCQ